MTLTFKTRADGTNPAARRNIVNQIIYIVGLVVVIGAVLTFFGLR